MPTDETRCPDEVMDAVLQILSTAILSIRFASWSGDARYAAVEANHIHNLPSLLRRYHPDKLDYYLTVARPSYLEELQELHGSDTEVYAPLWRRLEQALADETA